MTDIRSRQGDVPAHVARGWRRAILFAGVATLWGCASLMPPAAPSPAAAEAEVRGFLDDFKRLTAAAQWDSAAALYDSLPGFSWVESGAVVARSRAEIRRGFAKVPLGFALETAFDSLEVTMAAPGVALVRTRTRTVFVDRTKGNTPAFSFGTLMTMVLVRRDDGWKIRQGHASGPAAPR